MDTSLDKNTDGTKSKSKKHKKHKKKKKEAITLDEFLSMNQDVFGEGLDFQGIEEVPTQVVAKRLKPKKIDKPSIANLKLAQSSELQKLKKQGIVVKMKSTKKPLLPNVKVGNKIVTKVIQNENKPSTHVQSTPDDLLSKLINQSNSQIRIVKKSSQDNTDDQQKEQLKPVQPVVDNTPRGVTPENIEVECDVNMPNEYTSSENETKEEKNKTDNTVGCDNTQQINTKISNTNVDTEAIKLRENTESSEFDENGTIEGNIKDLKNNTKQNSENFKIDKDINELNSVTTLRNTENLKIKSVPLTSQKTVESPDYKSESEKINLQDVQKDCDEELDNSSSNTLNALKHLSHLITVKSLVPKKSSSPMLLQNTDQNEPRIDQSRDRSDSEEDKIRDISKESLQSQTQFMNEKSLGSLDSLKTFSKNITIKPVTHSPKNNTNRPEKDEEQDNDTIVENNGVDEPVSCVQTALKSATSVRKTDSNLSSPKAQNMLKITKPTNLKEIPNQEKQVNMNFLKHLTNVTAKPVSVVKSNAQTISNNIISTANKQTVRQQNVAQSISKKQEIRKEDNIEIFNIDDSDDDLNDKVESTISTPKSDSVEKICKKSLDSLKNISKHITVKPVNQQPTPLNRIIVKKINPEENIASDKSHCSFSEFSDDEDNQNTVLPKNVQNVQQKLKLQNDHLRNTLKNLGKHITVKSGNPSPNSSIKSIKDFNSRENFDDNDEADSDDSCSGKVKITEMADDNDMSDDDTPKKPNKFSNSRGETSIIKSPGESNSDQDHENFDEDDEFLDLEHQIKASTLKRPNTNLSKVANFKTMNKNVTIKSLPDKKGHNPKEDTGAKDMLTNINSGLSIKPFKQMKNECSTAEEVFANKKSIMNAAQVKRSIINQNQSMNRNIALSNQQNTVNKEVTVKTFQTKTVIQEITTTVTKTIKTVNQTVKQEVQSTSQNNSMKLQKVQGMKSTNQQIKSFQGVTVRHATPMAGTKIRSGAPPNIASNIRPPNQVIPCNQLVPFRPARNTARMSVPRMPANMKKNITPVAVGQPRPALGRPLKISPNVVSAAKRPTEEPMGHFSCFKKPKESLIPVSEIPSFVNEQIGESTSHFSSSQMSRSNFTTATKTVKGNTVVTQTRSEVSASSQQLEKLNSMSGLKVVKSSQSKHSMKVEEKSEMNSSKRNTLEAIEKLQKQGLLVKKPRLEDVSNDSDHSGDIDAYITEEPDD